jgi:hypothetical protein
LRRITKPADLPIATKFSLLANDFFPPDRFPATAQQDIDHFTAINKIRNKLIHSQISHIPKAFEGMNVLQTVDELAHRYFLTASTRLLERRKISLSFSTDIQTPLTTLSVYFGLILPSHYEE